MACEQQLRDQGQKLQAVAKILTSDTPIGIRFTQAYTQAGGTPPTKFVEPFLSTEDLMQLANRYYNAFALERQCERSMSDSERETIRGLRPDQWSALGL